MTKSESSKLEQEAAVVIMDALRAVGVGSEKGKTPTKSITDKEFCQILVDLIISKERAAQIALIDECFEVAMAAKERGDTRVGRYREVMKLLKAARAELKDNQ